MLFAQAVEESVSQLKKPANVLLLLVGLMTLAGVAFDHSSPRRLIFWYALVPVFLVCVTRQGMGKSLVQDRVWWLIVAYALLFVASLFWSEVTKEGIAGRRTEHAVKTMLFVSALFLAVRHGDHRIKDWLAKILVISCVIAVSVSVYRFYNVNPLNSRLHGMFSLGGNPVYIGPLLLGCMMSAVLLSWGSKDKYKIIWLFLGFAAVLIFCVLSQTRTPLFATLFFMIGYVFVKVGWKLTLFLVVLICLALFFFIFTEEALAQTWADRISRGLTGRQVIWYEVWQAAKNKLFFGYGYATVFNATEAGLRIKDAINVKINHPHGLFFSTLYYLGAVGVAVVGALILSVFIRIGRLRNRELKAVSLLMLLALLMGTMTDFNRPISSYNSSWWIWWLPFVILLVQPEQIEKNTERIT